jgi:hypothetical protein
MKVHLLNVVDARDSVALNVWVYAFSAGDQGQHP